MLVLPAWATATLFAAAGAVAAYELLYRTGLVKNRRLVIYAMVMAVLVAFWSLRQDVNLAAIGLLAYLCLLLGEMLLAHAKLRFEKICLCMAAGVLLPYLLCALVRIRAMYAGMDPATLLEMARSLTALLAFDSPALAWCAVGVLVFGLFLGFSAYSFTMGVSRDGEDFFFMRGLPMNWSAYLAAKFVAPFALSTVPMLVLIVVALVVLGVPAAPGAYLVAVYLGATVSLGLLSLGLGALFPRLAWDNEAQLVKGGGATLMVFAGLLVGVAVMALPALALLAGALWEVLAMPVALGLALALFVAECAALVWWVLGPCSRSLSRRER